MEGESKKKKAAIYIRVSTVEQDTMFWNDNQLTKIKDYLRARWDYIEYAWEDIPIDDISFDDDFVFYDKVSWWDWIEEREEMTRMFDMIDYLVDKPFDLIIVYKIDRFARSLKVLLEIVERLKKNDIWFISTQESIDTSTPFWTAMLWILWVFAELEKDMIVERTAWGILESLKLGKPKRVPYWYRKNDKWRPIIHKEESNVVDGVFEDYVVNEMKIDDICKKLIHNKVLTPTYNGAEKITSRMSKWPYKWTDNTIRKMLSNEFHTWKFYYNKSRKIKWEDGKKRTLHLDKSEWVLSEHLHIPIVDIETFNKAQELLLTKKWNFNKPISNYLLSWLLRCWYCKEHRPHWAMDWAWTDWKYYKCSWKKSRNRINGYICPVIQLWRDDMENLVVNEIKWIFNNIDVLKTFISNRNNKKIIIANKEKELGTISTRLEENWNAFQNIKMLWEQWIYTQTELMDKLDDNAKNKKKLLTAQKNVMKSIKNSFNDKKYKLWLNILKQITNTKLEELFSDKKRLRRFLRFIIDDIIIYSRDREKTDVVRWWPTSTKQQIPYKIKIRFKLPQEFLKEYINFTINK